MSKTLKKNKILFILILIFLIIFLTNPKTYMTSTLNGLNIWFYNVLPCLFPFFIATRILIYLSVFNIPFFNSFTKKLFKVHNAGNIFLLSLISGYPIGAKLTCEAYNSKQLSLKSAKKMMSFCSVSGPMFIVGSIGIGVFNSAKVGFLLLFCHLIGAILNGILFRNSYAIEKEDVVLSYTSPNTNNLIADSMLDSINSILLVGGYIVFANVLIDLLNNLNIIPFIAQMLPLNKNLTTAFLNGLIEMTCGVVCIGKLNLNYNLSLPLSSFLIAFGGLSIFLQSLNFTSSLNIKKSYYLLQKFCQGIITLIVSILVCMLF